MVGIQSTPACKVKPSSGRTRDTLRGVSGLDDLYQQLILDHYRNRRNEGRLDDPTVTVADNNPLCGDEITLDLIVEDGRITGIAHEGHGCSISQASASMMSECAKGQPADDALALVEHFRLMMHAEEVGDEDRLGDADRKSVV